MSQMNEPPRVPICNDSAAWSAVAASYESRIARLERGLCRTRVWLGILGGVFVLLVACSLLFSVVRHFAHRERMHQRMAFRMMHEGGRAGSEAPGAPQGPRGPQGPQGPHGPQGPRGFGAQNGPAVHGAPAMPDRPAMRGGPEVQQRREVEVRRRMEARDDRDDRDDRNERDERDEIRREEIRREDRARRPTPRPMEDGPSQR